MILVLSDLWVPFPGGAERLVWNIARDMYRRGMDVEAVTGYEAALRLDGPPVQYMDFTTDRDAGGRILNALLDSLEPSVVLTHHHYAYRFQRELEDSGVPLVQIVLNGHRLPSAALAVYISEWTRRTCGDSRADDLTMTPPAFDDIVSPTHGTAIGFVKPLHHKGIETVYAIAAIMPERKFVILRGEWPTLEVIRPAPNIEFMDPVVDMRDFYARCRLILMPSLSEDAGTIAQEATRNGLPCLSTNVGGLAETNAGGLLFRPTDTAVAWARNIRQLDSPFAYATVVASQRRHLDAQDHVGSLDALAARIGALSHLA